MNSKQLARNLAQSLRLVPWSVNSIRNALARRLPRQLQRHVDGVSAELLEGLRCTYTPNTGIIAGLLQRNARFQQIFLYCQQHGVWPDPDLSPPMMWPITAFAKLNVPQLPTLEDLAEFLSMPTNRLDYLADLTSRFEEHADEAVGHYRYSFQAKKSGGMRLIEAPKSRLKAIQRQVLCDILDNVPVHTHTFGFVRGRNCITAANRHVGEQVVVCFDLRDFFPSISAGRAFGLFRCLGYPYEVARMLTGLCTTATPSRIANRLDGDGRYAYRKPHLPQGSPASPALANLAAFTLDRRLSGLARSLSMNYSRYADDLSFSGDKTRVGALLRAVPEIVVDEGFQLNRAKTRIMARTSRQIVTGVVVNDRLNVDRREFDRLKAVIHACGKPDDMRFDEPVFRESLLGKIAWVEAVSPSRGQKLLELLSRTASKRH